MQLVFMMACLGIFKLLATYIHFVCVRNTNLNHFYMFREGS